MQNTKKKIKIVHVIPTLRFGGAERLLADIAKYHDRERFEMKVVTVIAQGPFTQTIRDAGVEVIHIPNKGDFGFRLTLKLWKFFLNYKPDIVHTHLFGADVWGKVGAWLARVPVIISTEHNTWFDESRFKHRLKHFVSWLSTGIIAISRAVADYMVKHEGVNPKKIVIVHNRIEVDRFLGLPLDDFSDAPQVRLLSMGRLEEQKGFDVLLDALTQIRELPWTMTIVGNGSLLSVLEDRIQLLGLDKKVQLYGTTDEVENLYSDHDVFVLASRWEGLGLVIMEAMASGKPVVATKVGGIPELIEHGKTGLLINPENADELADMIKFVLDRRDDAKKIGEQARKYAKERFAIQEMVTEYENIYLKLLKKK